MRFGRSGPYAGPIALAAIGVPLATASCTYSLADVAIVPSEESAEALRTLRLAWEQALDASGVGQVLALDDLRQMGRVGTVNRYDVYRLLRLGDTNDPQSADSMPVLLSPDMFAGHGENITMETEMFGGSSPAIVINEDGSLLVGAYVEVTTHDTTYKGSRSELPYTEVESDTKSQYRILVIPPADADDATGAESARVYGIDLQPGDEAYLTPTGVTRISRREDGGFSADSFDLIGRGKVGRKSVNRRILLELATGKGFSNRPSVIEEGRCENGLPQLPDGTVIQYVTVELLGDVFGTRTGEKHPIFIAVPPEGEDMQYIDIARVAQRQAPQSWGKLQIGQTTFVGTMESAAGDGEAVILSIVRNEAGDTYVLTTTYKRMSDDRDFTYDAVFTKVDKSINGFEVILFDPHERTVEIMPHSTPRGSGPVIMRLGGGFGPLVRADTGQRTQYAILHPPLSSGTDTVHRPRKPTDYPPHQGKTVGRAPWHGNTPASGKPPKPYDSTKPVKPHRRTPRPRSQV